MTNAIIHDYSRYKYAYYHKYFFQNIACSDYMSNIHFGKNIECEYWYYKVRFRIALKAHTESVHELILIGQKCDTFAFGLIHF